MEFREANTALQTYQPSAGNLYSFALIRVADVSFGALTTLTSVAAIMLPMSDKPPIAQVFIISGIVIGGGVMAFRAAENVATNRSIRKYMSSNAIAACLAQTRTGPLAPKPHALFFIPGGLRRVLKSELRRRGVPLTKSDRLLSTFD